MNNIKREQRRKTRIRAKMHGTESVPRLSIHRTTAHIYAQLIDDAKAVTILGFSEKLLENGKRTKIEKAKALGNLVAKKALDVKIKKVVFDRGGYRYHGRIKSFAEGAREGGLIF